MAENMRVVPHNTEAERSLLGGILLDNELAGEIMPQVSSDDFYLASHKEIFDKMSELYHSGKEVDVITLSDRLEVAGTLASSGGLEYLLSLTDILPSAGNYKRYLEILKRDSIRRKLIRNGQRIIEDAFETEDAKMLVASAEKSIFDISVSEEREKPVQIKETIVDVLAAFDSYANQDAGLRGITTGFRDLDRILNGLNRSDLVLIAARPAAGKTSLAMNLVENAAIAGHTCAVFSLEMPKIQIAMRILCANAEVSMAKGISGKLSPPEYEKLLSAQERLSKAKIFVDDTASITPADLLSKARNLKARYGLDLIMVDYIQLMSSGGKNTQNRQLEIAEISRNLKLIARELNVPVVALSQLSRQVENRTPPIPQLSDLRDSGAIEQDADVIMFIHNPNAVKKDDDGAPIAGAGNGENRQIMIAKHRNGACGIVELGWIGNLTKFVNQQRSGDAVYVPPEKVINKQEEEERELANQKAEEFQNRRRAEASEIQFADSEDVEYDVPDMEYAPLEDLGVPPETDKYGNVVVAGVAKDMPKKRKIDAEADVSDILEELDF